MTIRVMAAIFPGMSAAEIILALPKLTEADRRAIREVLLHIANENPDVALCNQAALEGAMMLDRMEDRGRQRKSRRLKAEIETGGRGAG
jgi:hypothetical protein